MIVPAVVSSEIVVRVGDLPPGQLELLKAATTVKNEEREKAAKLKQFGFWDIPEFIPLWREERRRDGEHVVCLPRGFAAQFVAGLAASGHSVAWDDRRSVSPAAPGYFRPFLLRDYQAEFVADLVRAEQGVGMAPTSAGKTVAALGLMALLNQRSIVIVDNEALLEQWRMRAAQFFGFEITKNKKGDDVVLLDGERTVGKIGKGIWEERDLTICLRQTLSSRQWQTDAVEWGARWGLYVIDELHHLGSAISLQEVVRALPCRFAFGLSATPARTETQGLISGAIVGPLVASVDRQRLVDAGILVQPTVRVVKSDFEADFWVDHDSDPDGACQKPGCKKTTQHSHRNNWMSVKKALVNDESRNRLIAETIMSESGHIHLVGSRELTHLDLIEKALVEVGYSHPIYKLRGEENARGESQAITQELIREGAGVLLSTVAGEGLDIPPLDRVHVVFPMRQATATIQLIGRVERSSPGKTSSVVVDWHDSGCIVFDEQHRERMRTYRTQGLALESRDSAGEKIASGSRSGDSAANDLAVLDGIDTDAFSPAEKSNFFQSTPSGSDEKDQRPGTMQVSAPPAGDLGSDINFIEWWSFPERNEVWRRHRGCEDGISPWMTPHDGQIFALGETVECPRCFQLVMQIDRSRQPEFVVAITGSRTWTNRRMIERYVGDLYREAYELDLWLVLLHGKAKGADSIADDAAHRLGVEAREFEADWSRGKSAGNARNVQMLDEGKPTRVGAFSLGTSGTRHMVEESRRRGIRVDLHGPKGLVS